MGVLSDLEPKNVFSFFEEICSIPRPSYKEEKISNYLVKFAQDRNLEYYQDELYNVIIIKEATPGYEQVEPIILQGHMDMVCEKTPECEKDMEKEGVEPAVEGDEIYAKETTLGGDDGIALAYALAILDDDSLQHPRLEFLCTVSEEVGMEGAAGIDVSPLKGRKLLNMDSEEEGSILASCAGGCSAMVSLPIKRQKITGCKKTISLRGLTGGHSGVEIDKGRGNANVLLSRVLRELYRNAPIYLLSMEGGKKDNAIPRDCVATILVRPEDVNALEETIDRIESDYKKEWSSSDPQLTLSVSGHETVTESVLSEENTKKVIGLIQALPNGIIRMSQDIENLVETSLNLGVLILEEERLCLRYALRSSVGTAEKNLREQITFLAEMFGGTVQISGAYPAWEYKKESKFREDMVRIYQKIYGEKPVVEAIHAGVECGILAGKIPGLDCISIGPDMKNVHTTEERLSISSSKRMYEYVCNVIQCK